MLVSLEHLRSGTVYCLGQREKSVNSSPPVWAGNLQRWLDRWELRRKADLITCPRDVAVAVVLEVVIEAPRRRYPRGSGDDHAVTARLDLRREVRQWRHHDAGRTVKL